MHKYASSQTMPSADEQRPGIQRYLDHCFAIATQTWWLKSVAMNEKEKKKV